MRQPTHYDVRMKSDAHIHFHKLSVSEMSAKKHTYTKNRQQRIVMSSFILYSEMFSLTCIKKLCGNTDTQYSPTNTSFFVVPVHFCLVFSR